jgi:hypothetical protein
MEWLRLVVGLGMLLARLSWAQQCDPRGPVQPEFRGLSVPLDRELFPDELAARGVCSAPTPSTSFQTDLATLLANAEREGTIACDGACEPMRKRLVPLDDNHDLEDTTFQKECATASSGLRGSLKDTCLRVCVVERRRASAPITFLRTVRVLDLTLPWRRPTGLDTDIRKWLGQQRVAGPPSTIRFEVSGPDDERSVRADGWLYPGGPRLRLVTQLAGAGCGRSAWGIVRW